LARSGCHNGARRVGFLGLDLPGQNKIAPNRFDQEEAAIDPSESAASLRVPIGNDLVVVAVHHQRLDIDALEIVGEGVRSALLRQPVGRQSGDALRPQRRGGGGLLVRNAFACAECAAVFAPPSAGTRGRKAFTMRSPSRSLVRDPEKACPGLDPGSRTN